MPAPLLTPDRLRQFEHEWRTPLQGILGVLDSLSVKGEHTLSREMLEVIQQSGLQLHERMGFFLLLLELEYDCYATLPRRVRVTELWLALQESLGRATDLRSTTPPLHLHVWADTYKIQQLVAAVSYLSAPLHTGSQLSHRLQPERETFVWQLWLNFQQKIPAFVGQVLQQAAPYLALQWELTDQGCTLLLSQELREASPPQQHRNSRALVVDDNPTNRTLAQALLQALQVETITTDDPQVVHQMIAQQNLGIILMDIQMPGQDGYSLTQDLRRAFGEQVPPVVAFTARSLDPERHQLMDDLLQKPARIKDLMQLLDRWRIPYQPLKDQHKAQTETAYPAFMDTQTLQQLERYGGPDLIQESLSEFMSESQKNLQYAWCALQQQDTHALRAVCHILKGSAGILGIQTLSQIAQEMERNLRQDTLPRHIYQDFLNLCQAHQQLKTWWSNTYQNP
ncbi:MAG: response regulator [Bernardetiaceae bacterium]